MMLFRIIHFMRLILMEMVCLMREIVYGLDPNNPHDANSDQDSDGLTALEEFLAGSTPSGSIDIDGNDRYDALTDGLLILRMFGLDGTTDCGDCCV